MSSSMEGTGFVFSQHAYDNICAVYQHALVSHHEHAQVVLDRLTSKVLKPHSRILDVGCGTGKPITAHFADHGHDVTGVDHSNGMLDLARANVHNAKFLQVDMTSWEPTDPGSYDLAVASHCLYNLSVAQIRSLIYRLSRWVKMNGIVVVGMSYNQGTMDSRGAKFDKRGWAEGFHNTFLGYHFHDATFGNEHAWIDLIKSTGLEIMEIDRATCLKANNPNPDVQFYITSRRVQENSLLGPFPIPDTFGGSLVFHSGFMSELRTRLDSLKLKEAMFKILLQEPRCKVLFFSEPDTPALHVPDGLGVEIHQALELPPSGSYDGVILGAILHTASSPGHYIDLALQALSPTGPAKILVLQGAPDGELTNMLNDAFEGFDLPRVHHGYLLREAENKFRAAGLEKINYSYIPSSLNFGSVENKETAVAQLFSKAWTDDAGIQAQLEDRFKELLRVQFLFKSNGEITSPTVILSAERS